MKISTGGLRSFLCCQRVIVDAVVNVVAVAEVVDVAAVTAAESSTTDCR